jgi:hypothetical protein
MTRTSWPTTPRKARARATSSTASPSPLPGFGELEGVAHRTDYDLKQHQEHSKEDERPGPPRRATSTKAAQSGECYLPHVIEPSAGPRPRRAGAALRGVHPDARRAGSKAIMKFHPRMAPIKAAVFPLVNKDGMPEKADEAVRSCKKRTARRRWTRSNRSASATPGWTRRARRSASPSTATRSRRHGDGARPRHRRFRSERTTCRGGT